MDVAIKDRTGLLAIAYKLQNGNYHYINTLSVYICSAVNMLLVRTQQGLFNV